MPIRSVGRWAMNSMAISLAALIRSGLKSLASILVETSIARTMSIPSVSIFSICEEERGRAMATMISDRAAIRSAKGRCRSTERALRPSSFHGRAVETRRCGLRPESSRYRYSATRRTGMARSQRRYGYSKNITRPPFHSRTEGFPPRARTGKLMSRNGRPGAARQRSRNRPRNAWRI